jgi:Domain of unknown function (DUF4268)
MTAVIPLGGFERVPVREAWPAEDTNFTPWLANAENMSLLGGALNMNLEVETVEQSVGTFRADIIARVVDQFEPDHRVIIENQFGRTDHGHLGQLLTYLAGIEGAKTVVWIAERIQQDHRAAVEWLNANTTEAFSFFAIEIELWRIDNSPPAPRFNVVASPNDWTRAARSATRDIVAPSLAETRRIRLAYWTSFAEFLSARHSHFAIRPTGLSMLHRFPIDQTDFQIVAMIVIRSRRAVVGLFTPRASDKTAFQALFSQKAAIESEIGEPLDWRARPSKKRSLISVSLGGIDPADQPGYPELHSWMLDKMDRVHAVFSPRIRLLPPYGAEGPDDEEVDDADRA